MKKVIKFIFILIAGCIIINFFINISKNIRIKKSIDARWGGLKAGSL